MRKLPRISIVVEGGMVQDVYSDSPVEITVIDLDTDSDPEIEINEKLLSELPEHHVW